MFSWISPSLSFAAGYISVNSRRRTIRSSLRTHLSLMFAAALLLSGASVSNAGFNFNVNLPSIPVPTVVVTPPPAPVAVDEEPAPAPVVALPETPPQFVYVPSLGYYVAVGIPNDVVYLDGSYYVVQGGVWYRSAYYGGPEVIVEGGMLPSIIRGHSLAEMRRFREAEYRRYARDPGHYRGRLHEVSREERREAGRHEPGRYEPGRHEAVRSDSRVNAAPRREEARTVGHVGQTHASSMKTRSAPVCRGRC